MRPVEGIFLDADFRRKPQTPIFCARCQRDVPASSPRVWLCDDMQTVVPPGHSDAEAFVYLGECCRRKANIPTAWIVRQ
jgi:hypothetical protein